jgi:pyrroloquinoline quinone biosynthesis protein D
MQLSELLLPRRPTLVRAARLRFDRITRGYVLLSPERGMQLNASAAEIVLHCNGKQSIAEIVDALRAGMPAASLSTTELTADVLQLIGLLRDRGLLVLEPAA